MQHKLLMSVLGRVDLVALILRVATAAVVAAPFAVYYASAGSLADFLAPKAEARMPNLRFSLLSYNVSRSGSGYVLELRLSNAGDTAFGVRSLEGEFFPANREFEGKFSLESPVALEPGGEGSLRALLLPVQGDWDALGSALSRDGALNVTGRAVLALGGAELPLSFSVELKPSEVGGREGV